MAWRETLLYYKQSPYQRIAFFTESDGSFSLTLDDFWQFNSKVEHIYHECLFTMPGLFPKELTNVLVLGGGDGLGARELLKYPSVKNIEVVDLDPEIVKFAKENVFMKNLNKDSFNDPKVKITTTDAKKWLAQKATQKYDLIIVDFPDPTSDELWDLYTVKLYKQMAKRLKIHGTIAIQSSTYNTRAFELIYDRLDKVFPYILGYHTGASSVFCGFFLCSFLPITVNRGMPPSCKWLNGKLLNQLLGLPLSRKNVAVKNRTCGPAGEDMKKNGMRPGNLAGFSGISPRNLRRPGNLSGLGAFGKGFIAPPPAPAPDPLAPVPGAAPLPPPQPAAVTAMSPMATNVTDQVVDDEDDLTTAPLPEPMSLPSEEYTADDEMEAFTNIQSQSGLLSNPLVIVGLGAVLALPLVLRIIFKRREK